MSAPGSPSHRPLYWALSNCTDPSRTVSRRRGTRRRKDQSSGTPSSAAPSGVRHAGTRPRCVLPGWCRARRRGGCRRPGYGQTGARTPVDLAPASSLIGQDRHSGCRPPCHLAPRESRHLPLGVTATRQHRPCQKLYRNVRAEPFLPLRFRYVRRWSGIARPSLGGRSAGRGQESRRPRRFSALAVTTPVALSPTAVSSTERQLVEGRAAPGGAAARLPGWAGCRRPVGWW